MILKPANAILLNLSPIATKKKSRRFASLCVIHHARARAGVATPRRKISRFCALRSILERRSGGGVGTIERFLLRSRKPCWRRAMFLTPKRRYMKVSPLSNSPRKGLFLPRFASPRRPGRTEAAGTGTGARRGLFPPSDRRRPRARSANARTPRRDGPCTPSGATQVRPTILPALLEPILAAIEGGESTREVRNARALLAEIM